MPAGPAGGTGNGTDLSFRISAAYAGFTSFMSFEDRHANISEQTATATLGMDFGNGWALSLTGGAIVGGVAKYEGERHTLQPGWLAGVAVELEVVEGGGSVPFVQATFSGSVSGTRSVLDGAASDEGRALIAWDVRFAVTMGWNLWEVWRPYLSFRGFGGGAHWDLPDGEVMGTDRSHVQVAIGSTITIPGGVFIFGEYAPVFETAFNAGLGVSF